MSWKDIIKIEKEKSYFIDLTEKLLEDGKNHKIFPPSSEVFNAFDLCKFEDTKVVILGQDPYHQENQAHGLAFSVNDNIKIPPSLVNIFKEINSDFNLNHKFASGNLTNWANKGVLLLNASLTVRENQAGSHQKFGWQTFTDNIISFLNKEERPIVFILWGNYAKNKKSLLNNSKHLILESAHPSPLSAHNGFLGSKPFSKTNNFLIKNKLEKIQWII